jgi:histidinol-phosphatase (PHP family)
MPLPADYHMHTPLCRHAVGEPDQYAARAVELGLAEIGFSDHSPMLHDDFDDWRMRLDQLDAYVAQVTRARSAQPALAIRLALEVDYLPGQEEWVRHLASRHPWDYFIGSVHYVENDWDLDNPNKIARWHERDPDEVWQVYFERLTCAAESRLFDILGHLDLCKKFCFRPRADMLPTVQRFLDSAARHGVAIEVNTAGLRKDCREIYPSADILLAARERHVPITFGSDAHAPGEVGHAFAQAIALARRCGYTHWLSFRRHAAQPVPL